MAEAGACRQDKCRSYEISRITSFLPEQQVLLKALFENQNLSKEQFEEKLSNHQIKGLDEVDSDTLSDFVKTDLEWDELFPVESD